MTPALMFALMLRAAVLSLGILLTGSTDHTSFTIAKTSTCCWPQQFQAKLGRFHGFPLGGVSFVSEEEMLLSYDLASKRWGYWLRENYFTHEYSEMIYTEDYNTGIVTMANSKSCVRLQMPANRTMRLPCIPDDAEFVNTARLGVGDSSIMFDVWQWDENHIQVGEDARSRIQIAYQQDHCKPISETAWWTAQNFNYTSYIGFLEMRHGEANSEYGDPFEDLRLFYDCKDYDELPSTFRARPDIHAETIYLTQRIHGDKTEE